MEKFRKTNKNTNYYLKEDVNIITQKNIFAGNLDEKSTLSCKNSFLGVKCILN